MGAKLIIIADLKKKYAIHAKKKQMKNSIQIHFGAGGVEIRVCMFVIRIPEPMAIIGEYRAIYGDFITIQGPIAKFAAIFCLRQWHDL